MSCLHRYWLKEFLKLFFIIQAIILILFVFIEYLSMMNKFLTSDITLLGALWYVLLETPFMFVQVAPASILLSNIFVFGTMNRNNELLALKSSGISIYFLVKPAIFSGFVLASAMFLMGEILVPISMVKAHHIEYSVIRHQKNISQSRKNIWIRSGKKLIHFNYYDPMKKSAAGITIVSMGNTFRPESRFDAQKGYYKDGEWIFEHIIQQTYNPGTGDYDVTNYERKKIALKIDPEDFEQMVKKSDEMGYFELRKYVDKVKSEGYDATTYRVDLYGKIAFPFICVIMALTGAATGMKSFTKESIPRAITTGIIISFMYWFFHGFCMSLGYGNSLPPLLAAWAANLFFFCFGSIYLITTE
ncbi:MAG: LPS export ABC transporter permease LptG [Desulfobacula sp.]|jgi:lipopolysaccharide export system permease protein|nr:LPS export ABC transporter permease LptG [Desulfobacula sp.]